MGYCNMVISEEEFKELLKSRGLKPTSQRRAVFEVLQKNDKLHLTVEEIYDKVKVSCPKIGLATVYRTIQLLHELKLIETLNLDDGYIRYEISKINLEHHHHHLICDRCGRIIEAKEDLLGSVEAEILNKYGFKVNDHIVKFYGVCEACRNKQPQD